MLQAITYDPLILSFISCGAQTLCNHAPPFHPFSFHLITCFLMLLCIFPLFSIFEIVRICVFHMEIALWVHLSTLWNNCPQFVSSTWNLHCGLWGVSSSWWREKQCSRSIKKQARGWKWGAKGGEHCMCLLFCTTPRTLHKRTIWKLKEI
jgi:hypothetical protein